MPRLVAPTRALHADRPLRNLPAVSQAMAKSGQTMQALTLDEAIAWNLKEFWCGS
jgi:hypothetical protein